MTDSGQEPGGGDAVPKPAAAAAGRAGRVRATAAAWTGCALGGAACALQDRAAVAVGLAVAVVTVACAAAGLGAVLLGGSDRRSPFTRFMLLVCVLTGRPPGEYLPPGPGERWHGESPGAGEEGRPAAGGGTGPRGRPSG